MRSFENESKTAFNHVAGLISAKTIKRIHGWVKAMKSKKYNFIHLSVNNKKKQPK